MESQQRFVAIDFLRDLVFPKVCVGCGKVGGHLCDCCRERLSIRPREAVISEVDEACSLWSYKDPIVKAFIKSLKFDFITDLQEELSGLLSGEGGKLLADHFSSRDVLAPIPLHRRRELWRGFNQSQLIAEVIAERVGARVDNNLIFRIKESKQQARFKARDRQKNVAGIFAVRGLVEEVVLVDDVFTTGFTMMEAAKALKKAGIKKVRAIVLAS